MNLTKHSRRRHISHTSIITNHWKNEGMYVCVCGCVCVLFWSESSAVRDYGSAIKFQIASA